MLGVFPDCIAPIVQAASESREVATARGQAAVLASMEATKKQREAGGRSTRPAMEFNHYFLGTALNTHVY